MSASFGGDKVRHTLRTSTASGRHLISVIRANGADWTGSMALQQVFFDTAESLTWPAHPRPADLTSLTTA